MSTIAATNKAARQMPAAAKKLTLIVPVYRFSLSGSDIL
jgi:hypothetical protein